MNSRIEHVVGIDLGTTYSAIAYLDETGRPVTLPNSEGEYLTPSVVLFDGDLTVVGKEALKALANEFDRVALCAKREMGSRAFHQTFGGRQYPPEAIQAWILNKLRIDASRHVGPVKRAVITVPAYFDEVRRKATQDAGYIAGLEVLDIINEPTAAAVAFGYHHGIWGTDQGEGPATKVLVYDLGGGTFDVTVMEINRREFVTLATDGDVRLGGQDWDQRLVDFVAEQVSNRSGWDPRAHSHARGRLWRECEDAKRTLSARGKASITCEHAGETARVEVSRQQFEEMTQDLLERTLFTTRQTMQAAGLEWSDVDRLLLVGGSTRMPAVYEALKSLSGQEPDRSVSADEAVAHGAVLHAAQMIDKELGRAPRFQIINVNSHSLGVVATDPATKLQRNAILIPRNTPLPVNAKRIFKTQKSGQRSILVRIVEGESASPDACISIGRCTVRDLPSDLPAQCPVEVRFEYEQNGRLHVQVNVSGTDRELHHELTRHNSLSPEQLDAWRRHVSQLPLHDTPHEHEPLSDPGETKWME